MSQLSRFLFRFIYAVIGQDNLMRIAGYLNMRYGNRSPFTLTILAHDTGADIVYTLFGFHFVDRSHRETIDPLYQLDAFTQRDFDECWDELINNPDSYESTTDKWIDDPDSYYPSSDEYWDAYFHDWLLTYGQINDTSGPDLKLLEIKDASYCTCPNWHQQKIGITCPVCNKVVLPF